DPARDAKESHAQPGRAAFHRDHARRCQAICETKVVAVGRVRPGSEAAPWFELQRATAFAWRSERDPDFHFWQKLSPPRSHAVGKGGPRTLRETGEPQRTLQASQAWKRDIVRDIVDALPHAGPEVVVTGGTPGAQLPEVRYTMCYRQPSLRRRTR